MGRKREIEMRRWEHGSYEQTDVDRKHVEMVHCPTNCLWMLKLLIAHGDRHDRSKY